MFVQKQLRLLDRTAPRHPDIILTIPTDSAMAALAILRVRSLLAKSAGESQALLKKHSVFEWIGRSIDVYNADYRLVALGRRYEDDAVPLPAQLSISVPTTPNQDARDPSPTEPTAPDTRSGTSTPIQDSKDLSPPRLVYRSRRRITQKDWVRDNKVWLDKLGQQEVDQDSLKGEIDATVRKNTAALIPERYRYHLYIWLSHFDPSRRELLDTPEVEEIDVVEYDEQTFADDPFRASLRVIQSVVLTDPRLPEDLREAIKGETDRLSAFRDLEDKGWRSRWCDERRIFCNGV